MTGALATRISGSSDLYEAGGRQPFHSINFVTSHDGFPLNDLVSYNYKHNEANGEGNRDGDNNNYSSNYGFEGPTRRKEVERLRYRQIRNMLATLMLSQGVPMMLSGDECRRTQRGNNNAYCQDNAVSWFDWKLVEKNVDLVRFSQALIRFRLEQSTVRRSDFLKGHPVGSQVLPDVSWFGPDGEPKQWTQDCRSLACLFGAPPIEDPTDSPSRHVLLLMHARSDAKVFTLPKLPGDVTWRLFIDTAQDSPNDIFPDLDGPLAPESGLVKLEHHSLVCFVSTDE
jgi:glycogen operon protein